MADEAKQGPRTSVLTGATGALGRAAAAQLASRPGHLVLVARDAKAAEKLRAGLRGPGTSEVVEADLSNPASIRAAATQILKDHPKIHFLANIAGVYSHQRKTTKRGLEVMFATNHLGPFLLTNLLLPALRKAAPSRIVTVGAPSSTKLNFDDLQGEAAWKALHAFGASKMANLLFTYALQRKLKDSGVTAAVLHPGLMRSELMREAPAALRYFLYPLSRAPGRAASILTRLGTDMQVPLQPGGFYKLESPAKSAKYSYDVEVQDRLWGLSEKLVGLK